MAVVVQCYHCSNILELDEGFRGGVCRCSQCGSLLQVPKSAGNETRKARPAAPGAAVTHGPRPESPGRDAGGGSGASKAGEAATGSGAFARSPMRPTAPGGAPVAQRERTKASKASVDVHAPADRFKKSSPLLWVMIVLGLLIGMAVVIAVVIWIAHSMGDDHRPSNNMSNTSSNTTNNPGNTGTNGGNTNTVGPVKNIPAGPHFLTIKLTGKKIVFGLDAGSVNSESFNYFTTAVAKAVGTLADDQEFCVVLWKEDGPQRIPTSGWVNKSGLTDVQKAMDIGTSGVADAVVSMKYCVAAGGDQTIFGTAKLIEPDVVSAVLSGRNSSQQIDTVQVVANVDSVPADSALKVIAEKTKGTYLPVDLHGLKDLVPQGH